MNVLILDNYDSFTYNLYQQVGRLIAGTPTVFRNDEIDLEGIKKLAPDRIVVSPGPGHPENDRDFGVCKDVILELGQSVPILGVCLGHQGMIHHLGGRVVRAPSIVHGKMWTVTHDGRGMFDGLPEKIEVMRYHSLVGEEIPDTLEVTAQTDDGLVMAVRHKTWPMHGLQFHPESVGTPLGDEMLRRFIR